MKSMEVSLEVTLVTIVLFSLRAILGAPVNTPTINNPCQLTSADTDASRIFSLSSRVTDIISTANVAISRIEDMQNGLLNNLMLSGAETKELDRPKYKIPGLPSCLAASVTSLKDIDFLLQEVYQHVSRYIMHFKMVQQQLEQFDNGILVPELNLINDTLFQLLCQISSTLKEQNRAVLEFVDSSVVLEDIKNLSEAKQRHQRDYVLAKNAKSYLKLLTLICSDLVGNTN